MGSIDFGLHVQEAGMWFFVRFTVFPKPHIYLQNPYKLTCGGFPD